MKKTVALLFLLSCLISGGCCCCRKKKCAPDRTAVLCLDQKAACSVFRGLGTLAPDQTCVTLTRGKEALSVEFRCFFSRGKEPVGSWDEKNYLSLFAGEHVELLLSPAPETGVYFHFAVNPEKKMYLARCKDRSWKADGLRVETRQENGFWRVLFRIPWKTLETAAPVEGSRWKANFARKRHAHGRADLDSSWSGASDYHALNQMGDLVFTKKCSGQPELLLRKVDYGERVLVLTTDVPFPGRIKVESEGRAWKMQRKGETLVFSLDDSVMRFVPLKSSSTFLLTWGGCRSIRFAAESIRDVLLPDRFYCRPGETLRCRTAWKTGTLRVLDVWGKTFLTQKVTVKESELDIRSLPEGSYLLEYCSGNRRTTRSFRRIGVPQPLELPKAPLTISGTLFRMGKTPVYLLGTSYNRKLFHPFPPEYTLDSGTGTCKNAVRMRDRSQGRFVYKPVTGRLIPDEAPLMRGEWCRREEPQIPALYRLQYEASLALFIGRRPVPPRQVMDVPGWHIRYYEACKKAAPDLIYSLQIDNPRNRAEFGRACDVLEYASGGSSYTRGNLLERLEQDLSELRMTVPGKPLIFWLGGSIPNSFCRTPEELRSAVYLSILHGYAGNTIHIGHAGLSASRTRMWSFLSGITREIAAFYPAFAEGKKCAVTLPPEFAGEARKTADGKTMLVLVNLRDGENSFPMPDGRTRIFSPYEPAVLRLP